MFASLLFALAAASEPIVLSYEQALEMSSAELEALLLTDFPHGRIIEVTVPTKNEGPHGEKPDPSLQNIFFFEQGLAAGGRVCEARRITVTFDNLDGGLGKPFDERSGSDPKRRFRVKGWPRVAVLDVEATDDRCAALTPDSYAQMTPTDLARSHFRQLLTLGENEARLADVPLTCMDRTQQPAVSCQGSAVLAALDWSELFAIRAWERRHNEPGTRVSFDTEVDNGFWSVFLIGDSAINEIELERNYPPPF